MKKALLATLALGLAACAARNFENVRLGMTQQQMIATAGEPHGVIAGYEANGERVEVFEYRRGNLWWGDLEDPYWFYFANDKLVKWGRPGDRLRYVE